MKEHEDCVMPSIEKSSVTVDSTAVDEFVTGSLCGGEGKIEGFLAERDEGEDMMVDVVGDVAVDGDHGRTEVGLDSKKGSLGLVEECMQKEAETHDLYMEEAAASGEDVCHASVGSRVLNFEEVEVTVNEEGLKTSVEASKCVLQGNVITAYGSDGDAQKSGTWVRDSKMAFELTSGEPEVGGGDIEVTDGRKLTERGMTEEVMEQHVESVEEVADRDCVMDKKTWKEAEILDSSKIAESLTANLGSQEVDMVVVEEGFASKDEAENSVSVAPSLVCDDNQNSSTELVDARTGEVVGKSKEESLHPTIKVITDDAQGNEIVESLSTEPRFVGGENDSIDMEKESERGLSEVMEQPMECDQQIADGDCVVNEKIRKESETLDSSKISEPSTTTCPGSEDVDDVVVEEGLASEDEAQDGVSVDQSLVCPDNRSVLTKVVNLETGEGDVIVQAENLDQQTEVDKLNKKESFLPTIEVITNDAQKPENGTGVGDSRPAVESSSGEPQFGGETDLIYREETERGLTEDEEIVEQPTESVQDVTYGDDVMDEKTGEGDEVLDSAKILESLTTANLGVEEVLTSKIEAQDSDSVDPRLDSAENRSLLTEVVDAGTGQDSVHVNAGNSDQRVEVDTMIKDESMHPTIEVTLSTEADEVAAFTEVDELTTASDVPNSEVQVTSAGGIGGLVESQRSKANAVLDSSRPDVAACTEAESSIDQTTAATANKVIEIDTDSQNCKVYVEDQGLKAEAVSRGAIVDVPVCAKPSNDRFLFNSGNEVPAMGIKISNSMVEVPSIGEMNGFQVSADAFDEVNSVTPCADVAKHCVLPEDLEFSYEEAHLERGEDAGMDIDEVLGWKDETPGIDVLSGSPGHPEKDQNYKVNANSEGDVEQGVLIGQQEENYKSRQPIVYERRVHVEVPLYDALDGSRSPLSEDENLKVETDSEEDDESVQEEEQKVVGHSTNLPRADELVNEEPSTLASLDTVSGGNHPLEAHVNEVKDSSVADKEVDVIMELTIAKAQLSSYGRYKGYRQLPELLFYGDILEDDSMLCEGVEQVNKYGAKISERRNIPGEYNASQKFENNSMDSGYPNKERSLSDLTDDSPYSGGGDGAEGNNNVNNNLVSKSGLKKKQKALDRPSVRPRKVRTALISTPKPSFKVGECIRRVASQLTGPPSVLKSNGDPKVEHSQHADQLVGSAVSLQIPEDSQRGRMIVEGKQSSVAEMLSQLHLTAQDPMKGYGFLNTIIPFFYERRAAVFSRSLRKNSPIRTPVNARKRKASNENDPEEFEFDDINDSYWTDRIIHNHSEEQLLQDNHNGELEHHIVAYEPDKPAKASRRSNKKRVSSGDNEIEAKE